MRLWHYKLIPHLPRQQLLGQHRECCALRGLGWGKKHSTVDYIFKYNYENLVQYHCLIMHEMLKRGYKIKNPSWFFDNYRGKKIGYVERNQIPNTHIFWYYPLGAYPEHNHKYLQECLNNLKNKGIIISV
ncbi:MAG: TIGR02328 family protein [Planctomycetota bacterium]|jgi:uncharacterized protein (TIGR02328 family)